ncbi:MAG: methyltransferase family protein [Terriglobales bacterium]
MTIRDVFRLLLQVPWVILLIYWIIGAFKTRPTHTEESLASRYLVVLLEVAGYLLIFNHSTEIGFLGKRFIPHTLTGAVLGVLLTWIGIGLAIWARYHLAEYWSARVTIKEDHQLIRTGPYAHFRHPIYSGLTLAMIGTALVIGKWRCVLGLVLALIGHCIKARKEEEMLTQQFGDAFREHQTHAGFLLPRFR